MRDPELLRSLLREMDDQPNGRILIIAMYGMSEQDQRRRLHVELLCDAGLAEHNPPSSYRITNKGFDFIEGIDKKPGAWEKFLEVLDTGAPLLNAVAAVAALFAI